MRDKLKKRIDIASGRKKADFVLKNCKIVNVFTEEIIEGDIAISDEYIAGIGKYDGIKEYDLEGKYVAPGLIDGHVHIESSMVSPSQFSKSILPRGTTTVIADPHEIANVCGLDGIKYIINDSKSTPLDVFIMLPSCVPATPFENSGAILEADELRQLMDEKTVLGLGEMMNFPGLISADDNILKKIEITGDKIIDGHGPMITDKDLNAYITAGIRTEHECTDVDEMLERLQLGMYVIIREGSAARNLHELIRGVSKENLRRVLFCTDDRHPEDILKAGHIDNNVRMAIKKGTPPLSAIKMATLNAAECYRLYDRGAIAPSYKADLIIFDNLHSFNIERVLKNGKLVAFEGDGLFEVETLKDEKVLDTVNISPVTKDDLKIKLNNDIVNVIKLNSHSLVTDKVIRKVHVNEGEFEFHESLDILKLAVIERHKKTGNVGLGLVEDFMLKNGAIASTVAHDSHNLIVIGDNDADMLLAVNEIENIGGGLVVVSEGKVLRSLTLSIAGLMSDKSLEELDDELKEMYKLAEKLGVNPKIDPFMTLAFLALPVIPSLKLTDKGLFDVEEFKFVDLEL